jgi:phosphoglycerate dehydrogenase-like enzyme
MVTQDRFRVAISGDFRQLDGSPTYPDFDVGPLFADPGIEAAFLEPADPIRAEQIAEFDALILLTTRFMRSSIHPNGRLALIARFGVGYDAVDVKACAASGIAVSITPDAVRRPVAVSIITLMLALTGKLPAKDKLARAAAAGFERRRDYMGVGLVGRTLGSLGLGNIGTELFRLVRPFDMHFIAHDPFVNPARAAELNVELVSLEELFRRSDVLNISCPLTDETRHLVGETLLNLMKPTAFLINTARGPIIDQKALTAHLQQRRIAGAALDVLEKEPPDAEDPILILDNVILAPHALCWTDQSFAATGALAVKAVMDLRAGHEPSVIVDRSVLESALWRKKLARFRNGLSN